MKRLTALIEDEFSDTQYTFKLNNGENATISIYHDTLDDILYATMQVEDKDGKLLDYKSMCCAQTPDRHISVWNENGDVL